MQQNLGLLQYVGVLFLLVSFTISYINSSAGRTAIINNGYALYLGGPYTGTATIHLSDYGISTADYSLYTADNFYPVVRSWYGCGGDNAATQNNPYSSGNCSVSYDSAHGIYSVSYAFGTGNIDGNNSRTWNTTFYGFLYVP